MFFQTLHEFASLQCVEVPRGIELRGRGNELPATFEGTPGPRATPQSESSPTGPTIACPSAIAATSTEAASRYVASSATAAAAASSPSKS